MRGLGIYGPANPSAHDASSLGQIKHGLEIVHVSGLNFACQLTSIVWEASSRTIRKLRLALLSEARSLLYAILAPKFIAKLLGSFGCATSSLSLGSHCT